MMILSEPGFIGLRSCYFSLAFVQESVILVLLFIPKTIVIYVLVYVDYILTRSHNSHIQHLTQQLNSGFSLRVG